MIKFFSLIASSILTSLVIGMMLAYPLMLLWNGCLVGAVANVHEVTIFQMFGIQVLVSLLINGLKS